MSFWSKEVTDTGLMKGRLVSFCSVLPDSHVVGDGFICSPLIVRKGGCDIRRVARGWSAESSIHMIDGGGSCDCSRGLTEN